MRNKYLIAAVTIITLGIAGFLALRPLKVNTAEEVFHRIKNGMTEKEVQEILGGPAGDYLGGKYHENTEQLSALPHPDAVRHEEWLSEGGKITVGFDTNALVVETGYESIAPMSFLERMRKWLGL